MGNSECYECKVKTKCSSCDNCIYKKLMGTRYRYVHHLYCEKHILKCSICNKNKCFKHGGNCSQCKILICNDNSYQCSNVRCNKTIFCKAEHGNLTSCTNCKKIKCLEHNFRCQICNKNNICADCNYFCKDCDKEKLELTRFCVNHNQHLLKNGGVLMREKDFLSDSYILPCGKHARTCCYCEEIFFFSDCVETNKVFVCNKCKDRYLRACYFCPKLLKKEEMVKKQYGYYACMDCKDKKLI